MEAPLPGHGDTVARVPDYWPSNLQHQVAAKSCASQVRSRALGSGTPGRRDRAAAFWAQAQPGREDHLGLERGDAPALEALGRDGDDAPRHDYRRRVPPP